MSVHPETQCFEYPVLYKENRMWKIIIRLIKADSQQNFTKVDWNLMEETQVPILSDYLCDPDALPQDIIAELWTETGQINGKITRSIPTYPLEKNKDKKNYRNCFQQAISVADSKFKKKCEEGFTQRNERNERDDERNERDERDKETKVDNETKDSCDSTFNPPTVFPMLAKMYSSKQLQLPVYVQPKLDGLRCVAFLDLNGQVVLQSRTKKIFPNNISNDRIRNELYSILENLNRLGNRVYLDGELYNHTTKLQTLNHYARGSDSTKTDTDTKTEDTDTDTDDNILQYHIYDIMTEEIMSFSERAKILEIVRSLKPHSKIVQVVFTHLIQTRTDFENSYQHFINYGYEGMMIREPKGVYQFGKRSGYLLKRKEVFTDEFPIVHFTSGTNGKDLNALIWICSTSNGIQFKVTPNLTYDERYALFKECNQKNRFEQHYKHRLLTVEYRGLSIDKVPQHAKGICIRDIE